MKWNKVSDVLPRPDRWVIGYYDHSLYIVKWNKSCRPINNEAVFFDRENYEIIITHWMDLPDMPEDYKYNEWATYYKTTEEKPFKIGKGRDLKTVQCVKCGSFYFEVASGEYYTGIRCVSCKWENCIHEG